jgi:hypothetical protein
MSRLGLFPQPEATCARCGREGSFYIADGAPVCSGCWTLPENIALGEQLLGELRGDWRGQLERFASGRSEWSEELWSEAIQRLLDHSPEANRTLDLIIEQEEQVEQDRWEVEFAREQPESYLHLLAKVAR